MKKLNCRSSAAIALLVGVGLLLTPGRASADVITFTVSGTFANEAAFLNGSTLTIDTAAGVTTASNLILSEGSNSPAITFTTADNTTNGAFQQPFTWDVGHTELTMFNGPTEFQGFTGGTVGLVVYFGDWGFSNGSVNTLLTPVPEPSDVSILGTGLLALIAISRRKLRSALSSPHSALSSN